MGSSSIVDQLLVNTSLPYRAWVMAVPLPPTFQVLPTEVYDRTQDSVEHFETFKANNMLHGFPGGVACRAFLLTLKGPVRTWFSSLVLGSIDNFDEMVRLFLTHFMAS
ncbi:hypothetical protein I3842_02G060400 [Carya illinoinensis]|uniref:Retrotransposon gag domain-containing protein n=1 Tax=Carya illinoinensis TaxID=32201 RepID=A0A922FPF1_CARIL|nr:hypothetical protein I3842_02G060400 [Carya illinoinensis]